MGFHQSFKDKIFKISHNNVHEIRDQPTLAFIYQGNDVGLFAYYFVFISIIIMTYFGWDCLYP